MVEESIMKVTEIGLLPEDWEIVLIGDTSDLDGGLAFKSSSFKTSGEYQVIKMANLYNGSLDLNRIVSCINTVNATEEKYLTEEGDILISLTGTAGKRDYGYTVYIKGNRKLLVNQRVGRIKSKENIIDRYQYYFTKSHFFDNQFYELAKGGTGNQANVSISDLKTLQIPLPSLPEQEAIAEALTDADGWIQNVEQLIAKKHLIKQGAMQELLTPKEDWEVRKLSEVITLTQLGANYPNSEIKTENPLIKMGNIQRGKISLKKIEYISPNVTPLTKDLLRENDLLFNTRNTLELVGKVCIWRKELKTAYFNSNIMRITFNKDIIASNVLMNAVFNSRKMVQHLKDIATGTTSVAAIYTRDLLGIEFSFPASLSEQIHISTILSDMDMEMEGLESQLAKVRLIKQGMMDELLTGKTRFL